MRRACCRSSICCRSFSSRPPNATSRPSSSFIGFQQNHGFSTTSICWHSKRHQHSQGYQSLGSFHSDDLGVLMSLSHEEYQAPSLPFSEGEVVRSDDNKSDIFLLDQTNWTFLNHGAFGAALRVGCHRAEQWRYYLEQQPLRYFDRDLLPHLAYANRRLVNFCCYGSSNNNSSSLNVRQGLTLIQNATAGMNTVLKGFAREYGINNSRIILWDTSYGSVKKMAMHIFGADQVTEIPLQKEYLHRFKSAKDPTSVFLEALDDTMKKLQTNIENDSQILLVLDHTTSNTAINMPINEIARHAKERYGNDKVQILVDGAHGLLAQEINLEDYTSSSSSSMLPSAPIDYYISNGHKWLSCPRGVAMLFCPHEHLRESVLSEPAIISHGVDEQDLLSRFVWDGTRDYAAGLALPIVLDFWQDRDPRAVRSQMKRKLMQGIQILVDAWYEENLQPNDWLELGITIVPTSFLSPMALIRLPMELQNNTSTQTSTDAKRFQDYLFDHNIEVPIKSINGHLYVRVSCHIHNTLDDFRRLSQVMKQYS